MWYGFWTGLVVLGLGLGLWQWERAAGKREYLAQLAQAPHLTSPLDVPPDGTRLTLEGEYLADRTLFLDNRIREGRLGVAVLTPLRGPDGRVWLVERGFLETGPSRAAPSVTTPSGRVRIEGQWQAAGASAPVFGPNREGNRLQRIDLAVWDLTFAHDGWLHLAQGPGRLPAWWVPSVMPPERHLAYAVQWWGLALAALVVMIIGGRRLARERCSPPPSTPRSSHDTVP